MHRRAEAGFTLIELLAATLVLALLAGLGWRGIDSVARTRQAAAARQQQNEQLELAWLQLGADLDQVCDAGPGLPALGQDSRGDLLLVRRAEASSRLQLVRWGVRDGRWLRWAAVTSARRSDLLAARERPTGAAVLMLDGVRSARMLAYVRPGSDWNPLPGSWVGLGALAGRSVDPQAIAALPTPAALRLSLDSANPAYPGQLMREFLLENRL